MPRPQMDCHAAPGRSTDAPRRPKSKASHDISTPAPQRLFEPWCSGRSAVVEFGPRPPICSRFLSLRSGRQRRLRAAPRCSTRRLRCLRRASTPCPAARFHGGVLGTTRTDTGRRRSAATAGRLCLPRFARTRGRLVGTHGVLLMRARGPRSPLLTEMTCNGRMRMARRTLVRACVLSCGRPSLEPVTQCSGGIDASTGKQRTGTGRSS
jgi:hypothetical protein